MRAKRLQKGVAAVEFAIVLIPLLIMVFGITEFGRAMYQYDALAKGVRNAARYLSTQAAGDGYGLAQNLALCGKDTCDDADPRLAPGLMAAMIVICDSNNSSGSASPSTDCTDQVRGNVNTGSETINLTTVKIEGFGFDSLVNLDFGAGLKAGTPDITFGAISNTMRQAL